MYLMTKKPVNLFQMRIEAALWDRLETWIGKQRIPPSKAEVVRYALIEFLDREEGKERKPKTSE